MLIKLKIVLKLSQKDLLLDKGYVFKDNEDILQEEDNRIINSQVIDGDVSTFVDPNGPRCSQECIDDCPEDYICSSDCYIASLTDSGCGCCQCLTDNECAEGFYCSDVNECVEI
jgi:hypothetical protein